MRNLLLGLGSIVAVIIVAVGVMALVRLTFPPHKDESQEIETEVEE